MRDKVTLAAAFKHEKVRKNSFQIYDMNASPVRINRFRGVRIDNRTNDSHWHTKRYKMDVLMKVLASYEFGGETFTFFYWINSLPVSYNRYSRNRALTMNYTAYLFNIEHPQMIINSISEERIIITDLPYIVPIRKQVYNDLSREGASESLHNLNDAT